jgi:hypothetical protein
VSETFWLSATNLALGVVTIICAFVVTGAVVREVMARAHKRAKISRELDRDMRQLVADFDDHAFLDPELGITMADGGEKIDPDKPKERR